MKACENCLHSEILDWDWDEKNKKSIPDYWCEKKKQSCKDILECGDFDKGDDGIYADSDRLPPCRVRDDIPDFYRK